MRISLETAKKFEFIVFIDKRCDAMVSAIIAVRSVGRTLDGKA